MTITVKSPLLSLPISLSSIMLIHFQRSQSFKLFVIKSIKTFHKYQRTCIKQPLFAGVPMPREILCPRTCCQIICYFYTHHWLKWITQWFHVTGVWQCISEHALLFTMYDIRLFSKWSHNFHIFLQTAYRSKSGGLHVCLMLKWN